MFFNIQRWSLHDGPGIRTTVFFQGCPLRCRWCSNPESWEFKRQANSPALDEVVTTIEKDAVFYRSSGGGVTFSGGEPFAQPDVLRHLADTVSLLGIKTAVETSGYFIFNKVVDIIDMIDDIFVDMKHTNDTLHKKLTGVSNKGIIENIFYIDKLNREFVIRIPLIKDINDTPENINGVIKLCSDLNNLKRIELLPYHPFGAGKYKELDLPYDHTMAAPDLRTINSILDLFKTCNLEAACSNADYVEAS